jgi:hypothetical protein
MDLFIRLVVGICLSIFAVITYPPTWGEQFKGILDSFLSASLFAYLGGYWTYFFILFGKKHEQ